MSLFCFGLCSNDKHEFIVPREVVMASGTIKAILTGRGLWREITGPMPVIEFQEISGPVLEKIIQYFFYKKMYDKSTGNLPPFPLDTDSLLELLNAANFLDT
jgi:transcription elongation factor B subunit 1